MTSRALVLGGGGVSGIAWELGVLFGLQRKGALRHDIDLIIGTSAGASVAAQVMSAVPLPTLYEWQLQPESQSKERLVSFDADKLSRAMARARRNHKDPSKARASLGAMALEAKTVTEKERMKIIRARLPENEWPERSLLIPAVDAYTGEAVIFDRTSGVTLAQAVAASCAVPGVWPPVTIGRSRFIDGGVRSNANADLAAGLDRVLIITPSAHALAAQGLRRQVAALRQESLVTVITADANSVTAMGTNWLDPRFRRPSAEAGLAIGQADAPLVVESFG